MVQTYDALDDRENAKKFLEEALITNPSAGIAHEMKIRWDFEDSMNTKEAKTSIENAKNNTDIGSIMDIVIQIYIFDKDYEIPIKLLSNIDIAQEISLFNMSRDMFLIVAVPVILGLLVKRFASEIALNLEPISKKVSTVLFIFVLLGAIAAERENIVSYFVQAGLITLSLNIIMMIVAFQLARLLGSGTEQKKCITIECGLQNGTLAIFVATSIFGGGLYVIPAATYSLIMFATSLIFIYFVRKTLK